MNVPLLGLAAVVLAGVIVLITRAGSRFSRTFRHDVATLLAGSPLTAGRLVTDSDLAALPSQVGLYLRRAGVVGHPRVMNFHAVFAARMRNGRQAPWMSATIDQWNFMEPKARLFLMHAKQGGIPFTAFHRYIGEAATFEVRVAGLFPIIRVAGPTMTRSETVTLFNDMCLLAPATLIDAAISWSGLDASRVRGEFVNAGHRISAELTFDGAGDLVSFRSDDRHQNDGKRDVQLPWITPVTGYRDFGGQRVVAAAEAHWVEDDGEWAYGEFELQRIDYNVR